MKQSRTHVTSNRNHSRAMAVSLSIKGQCFLISEGCVFILCRSRYTIMSGTPEKILEHLLEMMRLDSRFTESGIPSGHNLQYVKLPPDTTCRCFMLCYIFILSSSFSHSLSRLCPLSYLSCLFLSIINLTELIQLRCVVWFHMVCIWQHRWHVAQGPMALARVIWDCLLLSVCCRHSTGWLHTHALRLHPKRSIVSGADDPISFQRSSLCFPLSNWPAVHQDSECETAALLLYFFNRCALTTLRPHKALNRRSWTTPWTTSAGWSAWWCSGPLCTEIVFRKRMSQLPF